MKDIAIYGAGGLGSEIQMLIEHINIYDKKWNFRGFFDDARKKGEIINGAELIGGLKEVNEYPDELSLVMAFGKPGIKKSVIEKIQNTNISYPVLIHPQAQIGNRDYVSIGEGSILTAGTIVAVNVKIGRHVLVNFGSIIGHDARIGDYTSIMPSVNVNGEVVVNACVYLGVNSTLINQIEIGENSTIGAGSVVFNSIRDNCMAIGMPAIPVTNRQ
jgi:sugar O-acyltransferase (sialic acid O-acetyltransferase NeuD family)